MISFISLLLPISVQPGGKKNDDKGLGTPDSTFILKYNEQESKDKITYILKQYNDYTPDAQYDVFLSISKVRITKLEFLELRKEIEKDLKANFQSETALMEYHVDHVMAREHTNVIDFLIKKLRFYQQKWEEYAYVQKPDFNKLEQLDRLIHSTARILAEFNMGTHVILFIQKKFEMLGNKNNIINIDDLNIYNNPYTNTSSHASSESSTEIITREDGRSLPKLKSNTREYAQGSNNESTETGSGGTQEADNRRTREAVF